jgi:hypothetical protein
MATSSCTFQAQASQGFTFLCHLTQACQASSFSLVCLASLWDRQAIVQYEPFSEPSSNSLSTLQSLDDSRLGKLELECGRSKQAAVLDPDNLLLIQPNGRSFIPPANWFTILLPFPATMFADSSTTATHAARIPKLSVHQPASLFDRTWHFLLLT